MWMSKRAAGGSFVAAGCSQVLGDHRKLRRRLPNNSVAHMIRVAHCIRKGVDRPDI